MSVARLEPGDAAFRPGRPGSSGDMLDHDDHVVDQQAHRRGDAPERHDVEAHPGQAERQHRGGKGGRHHQDGDQGHPPASQEQDQHDRGQHQTDQHRVAHAGRRLGDELALVVPLHQPHAGRQPEAGQLGLHRLGDLHGVAVRLFIDVEQHRRAAVLHHPRPLRHDPVDNGCHVAHPHHTGGIGAHHYLADVGGAHDAAVGDHQEQLAAVLQPAHRLQAVAGAERVGEIGHRQPVGGQPVRIGQHLHLGGVAALDGDPRQAGDRGEQRLDLVLGEVL